VDCMAEPLLPADTANIEAGGAAARRRFVHRLNAHPLDTHVWLHGLAGGDLLRCVAVRREVLTGKANEAGLSVMEESFSEYLSRRIATDTSQEQLHWAWEVAGLPRTHRIDDETNAVLRLFRLLTFQRLPQRPYCGDSSGGGSGPAQPPVPAANYPSRPGNDGREQVRDPWKPCGT
jgi:hypothetical protein